YEGDGTDLTSTSTSFPLTVNLASSTTTVSEASTTYGDVTAQGAVYSVSGSGTITGNATLDYYDNTISTDLGATAPVNAGNYTVPATYAGDANPPASSASATFTIAKANATVVVTPYTVTYDGSPHTATVTSITGVNGETGAIVGTVTLNTTHTNAGTYASDSWSFTGAANYKNIASTTITDTINKATATVVVAPYTVNIGRTSDKAQ